MKIIDEITQKEIKDPDLSAGRLSEALWASPEAYATIDDETKFALDDSDYETVMVYHVLTEDEMAQRDDSEQKQERQDVIDSLPDAVADLSEMVSDNATSIADIMDAIAELSEIVSNLTEGE